MTKKLIAIATADWHLNNWRQFSTNGRRLLLAFKLITKFSSLARKHKVPILFAGDLFHNESSISNQILDGFIARFKKAFEEEGLDFVGISGNHDMSSYNTPDHISPSYVKSLARTFTSLICVDNSNAVLGDLNVMGIPYYTKNQGFMEALEKAKQSKIKGKKNILLIHRDLPKALTPMGYSVEEHDDLPDISIITKAFDLIICGHIHKPMKLAPNLIMAGSPHQQNKGDAGTEMGYWEIYDDLSLKFVDLKYPEFIYIDEGQPEPDDYHFYIPRPIEEKEDLSEAQVSFISNGDRTVLASKYCEAIGEKDEAKIKLLTSLLNSVE
jgi:DNA repair exonuclease SbcCD nuclease subunit